MQAREAPRRGKAHRPPHHRNILLATTPSWLSFARLNFQTRDVYSETYDCGRGVWLARIPTIPSLQAWVSELLGADTGPSSAGPGDTSALSSAPLFPALPNNRGVHQGY